jgi:DNA-binding protein HU-beta
MALTDKERTQVKEALALIERETANDGDSIVLKGFGTFKRKQSAAKLGRNPQTGGTVDIPAKSKLAFSASPAQVRVV